MIRIYTIPSNYPSRRAVAWLKEFHIDFKEFHVHPDAPNLVNLPLKSFLAASENGLDDLLAVKSNSMVSFKLSHNIEEISLSELFTYIAADPLMLHFPIIFDSDRSILQCGFSEDDIRTFIPRSVRHDILVQLLKPTITGSDPNSRQKLTYKKFS